MKNLFLLPTDKPSRLILYSTLVNEFRLVAEPIENWKHKKHIYITSYEEIKEGDWVIESSLNRVFKSHKHGLPNYNPNKKKIILTTDPKLIADGVQAIDDTFLEWFVKNPTCEFVDLEHVIKEYVDEQDAYGYDVDYYKIIIPKQEQTEDSGIFSTSEIDELVSNEFHCNTPSFTEAIDLIAQERLRQVNVEGWSEKHDDYQVEEELAFAAATYATPNGSRVYLHSGKPNTWLWEKEWWKPSPENRIRELVKSGALIVAEIERLQRKEK